MKFFLGTILLLFLILEGSLTTFPLVLAVILLFSVFKKGVTVFFVAFASGLVIDLFRLQPPGLSSLCFVFFAFLVLLYRRKYEIRSHPFVFSASFFGSLLYLKILSYENILLQSFFTASIAVLLFIVLRYFDKTGKKDSSFSPFRQGVYSK